MAQRKESACNAGDVGDRSLIPGWGKSPGVGMVTHCRQLSIFAGESHGQRSLVICSPWGHKESDMTEETKHNRTDIRNRSFCSTENRVQRSSNGT